MNRFLSLVFLAFPFFVFAQTPKPAEPKGPFFPENPADFLPKLAEFVTISKRPDCEEAMKVFEKGWQAGLFRAGEQTAIISTANRMAEQRIAAHPYFRDYLNAMSAAKRQADTTVFEKWHPLVGAVVADLERGKNKPLENFLEFSNDFFDGRLLRKGTGGSVSWAAEGGRTKFGYGQKKPFVQFEGCQLHGFLKKDSITIRNASGTFFPVEQEFEGQWGKVTWRGKGVDSTVYAQLAGFRIDVTKTGYALEKVSFYHPTYFPGKALEGKFEDKVVVENKAVENSYPRFESADRRLFIENVGDGIRMLGGFRIEGSSVFGVGTVREKAQMWMNELQKDKNLLIHAQAALFIIKRGEKIFSEKTNVAIYPGGRPDSLFHPAVGMQIELKKNVVQLYRGKASDERTPFFNSFFNMNVDAERLSWNIKNDSLLVGARVGGLSGAKERATFESSQFYSENEYLRLQSSASYNPVAVLMIMWRDGGEKTIIPCIQFAQKINPKWNTQNVQKIISEMVEQGFINYYTDTEEIEIKQKLLHYARAAQGKADFDNIKIRSESERPNAVMDAKTQEAKVDAVQSVEFSVKQKTAVKPTDDKITLLQDRDMRFGGKLYSGFAVFEGQKMEFDYEKFQINLDSCRYLDFYVPSPDEKDKAGNPVAKSIASTIEYVTGAVLIDAPNNKSGKEDLKIFPSFQAKENSFIFYDKKATLGGVYKRDSFRFKLEPFPFNGLDSYTADDLKFKGTMVTAAIFPDFKETVRLRDDLSLGFVHQTPRFESGGYPTYVAKGKFGGELDLSNKGFFGKGTLGYLTATVKSEDLIFRPKQMTGTAKEFFMTEDRTSAVKTPQARGTNVSVNWLPYRDSMYVESKDKDFEIFKSAGYGLKGMLILTPSGLKGRGKFEWAEGILSSRLMSFGPFQTVADTCDFQIKALSGGAIAFDARNMNGNLDFDIQKGHFKANRAGQYIDLPFDKYRTNMSEFTWDMKAQTVTFVSDENRLGTFVSTDPERDSLSWTAKTAEYSLKTNEIRAGGVSRIKSADAFIFPETGDIEIQPGGQMRQLLNAKIVADTANQYHVITGATVDIFGKNVYKAKGNYEYNVGARQQTILFQDIVGQTTGVGAKGGKKNVLTTATGKIAETTPFYMDEKVLFAGDVVLKASQKNLDFQGFAKFDTENLPGNDWWLVNCEVDRKDAAIRYRAPKNKADEPLAIGLFLSNELAEMYPRIMLPNYQRVDRPIIDCRDGLFKYDPKTDKFVFGDSLKVIGKSLRGNKMAFDNRTSEVVAEGKINIGSGLDYIKVAGSGRLKTSFLNKDTSGFRIVGDILSGVTFQFPPKILDLMIADIKASTFDAKDVEYAKEGAFYSVALPELVADELDAQMALNGIKSNQLVLPKKENKHTLLFGKMPFRWNMDYQSFVSLDDKLPVLSINGEPIGKQLTGFVEYKMPTNEDDRVYIYLKSNADTYYFFGYQGGVLNVFSSNVKFMDALNGLKEKERIFKQADGENYEIVPVAANTVEAFVNRARAGRK